MRDRDQWKIPPNLSKEELDDFLQDKEEEIMDDIYHKSKQIKIKKRKEEEDDRYS